MSRIETDEHGTGTKCFLTPSSEKIWFYLPMLVILSINCGVYMIIIIKLAIAKWETRNVRLSTNQRSINSDLAQQLVIFYLKWNYFNHHIFRYYFWNCSLSLAFCGFLIVFISLIKKLWSLGCALLRTFLIYP